MRRWRTITGIGSFLSTALGLNLMLLREAFFIPSVLVPLAAGALCATLWVVLSVVSALRAQPGTTPYGLNTVLASLAFLGICVTLYAFVLRWDASWDLTLEGRTELSPQAIQVLQGLDRDVEITCFFVRTGGGEAGIAQSKTRRFLERCSKYTNHLVIDYADPQREPERLEQLRVRRLSGVGTVVLRAGAKHRVIPLSDVTARLEERDFVNALLNVATNASPKVYFLTGHGERDITNEDRETGGSDFRAWLQKEAYEVDRHFISADDPFVPDDCTILVINGYEASFHPHDIQALDAYIQRGGRILFLADPLFVLNIAQEPVENMKDWLRDRFGIRLGSDIVLSKAGNKFSIEFVPYFSVIGQSADDPYDSVGFRGSFNNGHPITRTLDKQLQLRAIRTAALEAEMPEGASGRVILRTKPNTWAETDIQGVIENIQGLIEVEPVQDPHEAGGPNPIGVAVSLVPPAPPPGDSEPREEGARIVVLGDGDLASNEGIAHQGSNALLLNSMAWLSEREDLIAIRPTGEEDPPILMSMRQQRMVAWIAALGPVQVIALAGMLAFLFRRRHE